MCKVATPFHSVGVSLITSGIVFAVVGASGQAAFGWTAAGLLVPGVVLMLVGAWRNRRRA